MQKNKSLVLICSGGLDSVTALYQAIELGFEVDVLAFHYGQNHSKELSFAKEQCASKGVEFTLVNLDGYRDLVKKKSALTSGPQAIPEQDYDLESLKQTVVPNRNMVFLSYALTRAILLQADEVWYGAHGGDREVYPDCRPEFVEVMAKAALLCDWHQVTLSAPWIDKSKTQVLAKGIELGVDYSKTWTCYKGGDLACGECSSCKERLQAFSNLGLEDPLRYASS